MAETSRFSMPSKTVWFALFLLLVLPVLAEAALPFPARMPSPQPLQQPLFASASSGKNNYYVGAEPATSACSQTCVPIINTGAETQVQVVSQQVTGCLSYWISDDSKANIWGQVGYYICDGSTPVAFYQIWNLNTSSVLATGTTTVSAGSHFFSMYAQSGTVWAYALDGSVFGTHDMGSGVSSSSHPVQALSEEGDVSAPWNPSQVQFGTAILIERSGVWTPVESASEAWGCGSSQQSCWGVQGGNQNSALAANEVLVGGSAPPLASGTGLWNGAAFSTTTLTAS